MLGALMVFAVFCGCAGAWRGNRASWALLASAGLSSAFIAFGVPFIVPVWIAIDLAVIGAIAVKPMKLSDCLAVALFFAAWPFYPGVEQGDRASSEMVNFIVAIQFILSAPWRWALHKIKLRPADLEAEGDFLKVSHAH